VYNYFHQLNNTEIKKMKTLSKTQAIIAARNAVGSLQKDGSGWSFTAPVLDGVLDGPRKTVSCNDFSAAREIRAMVIADLALRLMGRVDVYTCGVSGSVRDRVSAFV